MGHDQNGRNNRRANHNREQPRLSIDFTQFGKFFQPVVPREARRGNRELERARSNVDKRKLPVVAGERFLAWRLNLA